MSFDQPNESVFTFDDPVVCRGSTSNSKEFFTRIVHTILKFDLRANQIYSNVKFTLLSTFHEYLSWRSGAERWWVEGGGWYNNMSRRLHN